MHRLAVADRENQPVQAMIEIADSPDRREFHHPRVVPVVPCQRADVGIDELPTRTLVGQPESFPFDVQVAPVAISGTGQPGSSTQGSPSTSTAVPGVTRSRDA